MAGDVQAAWIAAGASIVVSAISLAMAAWTSVRADAAQRQQDATAQDLERLKSRLSEENDAAKAKRDYEYEARKRLYEQLYPLAYQLHESALHACNRIKNLALAARGGWLADGPDNWLTSPDPYYFNSIVHNLIAPLAIYELMTRKLTLLDLTLDHDLHRRHAIARWAYEALRSDYNLVDPRYPPLALGPKAETYAPPEARPNALPSELEQRWTWRQGLYSGQISQAVDPLLVPTGETMRVQSYAEFSKALAGADLRAPIKARERAAAIKQALGPMSELFRGFHPARRPITWRILLAQATCYRAIVAAQTSDASSADVVRAARFEGAADRAAFEWIGDGRLSIPPALKGEVDFAADQASAFACADVFLENVVKDFDARCQARA